MTAAEPSRVEQFKTLLSSFQPTGPDPLHEVAAFLAFSGATPPLPVLLNVGAVQAVPVGTVVAISADYFKGGWDVLLKVGENHWYSTGSDEPYDDTDVPVPAQVRYFPLPTPEGHSRPATRSEKP